MAAYASLVCLSNLMMQIRIHPRFSTFFDMTQIQYVAQNVEYLLDFVESYNSHGGTSKEEVEDLEEQIASAAYAAENLTEKYIEGQILAGFSEGKRPAHLLELHKVMADMDFIKERVMEVKEKLESKEKQPIYSMLAPPSKPLTSGKTNTMVGFDDELIQLMDLLTSQQSDRKIISIVGMGGMGKTTLARNVYENMLIMQYFDIRVWATISQEYSVREILLQLLSFVQRKFTCETVDELGEQLYKSLCGRRYLIVLDDMWSIDVWDEIKFFFPNNGESSRVVMTTRLSNVATPCSSSRIMMEFLDENKSWKLFCEKAFGGEDCLHELEGIGKEIVKKCKGLPLSIVVIGGHLRNSSRTKEYWVDVAYDINSVLNSREDEQCLSILTLSYSHLPAYLKPCFLFIGIFLEEDKEIRVSTLVKLWVAEGFILKQSEAQSLEEIAEVYLKDLVDRNLILVHEWSRNGTIKSCKIHDLLRDLCLMVAAKEKFVCASKLTPQQLKSCALKIQLLDTFRIKDKFCVVYPRKKFQKVCLRYLNCKIKFSMSYHLRSTALYIDSSLFLLWNLQTVIINAKVNVRIMAPSEIWEIPNLRHLLMRPQTCLPNPRSDQQHDDLVLHNLQTLLKAENLRLSEEVCKKIPNIKQLKLTYDGEASSSSYYCLHNLCCFEQLKSLRCSFSKLSNWSDSALNLPSSLCKLSLRSRYLDWEYLTMIATMVPRLEVLKLEFWDSNIGQFKGEFPCLKSLSINCDGDFIEWNADKSHFPVLNNLVLTRYRLAEIPPGIREIPTLRNMDLSFCGTSAAVSAVKMVVEQEELGDKGFQLLLDFWSASDEERFWEMVEEEDLATNNVLVKYSFRTNTTMRMSRT